jgi:hypothetical protein
MPQMNPQKARETWLFHSWADQGSFADVPGSAFRRLHYRLVRYEDGKDYIVPFPMSDYDNGNRVLKTQGSGPFVSEFRFVRGHPFPAFSYGYPVKSLS